MWIAKKDLRVELPDGSARLCWADMPIPEELIEYVHTKERKRVDESAKAV